jgi:molybdopterin molybdotransferase
MYNIRCIVQEYIRQAIMSKLLNLDEALRRILQQFEQLPVETIALPDSLGRVLADNLVSDIQLPPFDNSAMDGFAIKAADSLGASIETAISLQIVMDIPAGIFPEKRLEQGQAARIMTGAPIPDGADAVIPVEDTDADFSDLDSPMPNRVGLHRPLKKGAAIRVAGENIRIGETIFPAGTIIHPAEIGMLASLGHSKISVLRKPRVVIVGSGDELLGIDEPLEAGKIRDSNSYTLAALVTQDGGEAIRLPIVGDNPDAIRELFEKALAQQPDIIISSAGVSVGAADYVRSILDEIGEIGFWRINIRPGKPLAFGKIGDVPFFGLPGNPVSAMVTYDALVRPALLKCGGKSDDSHYIEALTGETMRSDGRRTFARVRIERKNGQFVAYETGTQSSGALVSMVKADGLLIIPENIRSVDTGTKLKVKLLRPFAIEE